MSPCACAAWANARQLTESARLAHIGPSSLAELKWLDDRHHIFFLGSIPLFYALGGLDGLLWGFVVSTILSNHASYGINSLVHVVGQRRFNSGDDSRNCWWFALLTHGEVRVVDIRGIAKRAPVAPLRDECAPTLRPQALTLACRALLAVCIGTGLAQQSPRIPELGTPGPALV